MHSSSTIFYAGSRKLKIYDVSLTELNATVNYGQAGTLQRSLCESGNSVAGYSISLARSLPPLVLDPRHR